MYFPVVVVVIDFPVLNGDHHDDTSITLLKALVPAVGPCKSSVELQHKSSQCG
jgi:hypothetical protein